MNWLFAGKSHGGIYPCINCWRPYNERFDDTRALLTIGDLRSESASYKTFVSGKTETFRRSHMRTYRNCIRDPLLEGDNSTLVIDVCTPNPLHMKLRSVNKVYGEFVKREPTIAAEYIRRIGVTTEAYHQEFEGRPCSKIVRSFSVLRDVIRKSCEDAVQDVVIDVAVQSAHAEASSFRFMLGSRHHGATRGRTFRRTCE